MSAALTCIMKPRSIRRSLESLAMLAVLSGSALAAPPELFQQSKEPLIAGTTASAALPGDAELAKAKVVLLTGGAPWSAADRQRLEAYVEKGGGLVLVHDAIPASGWVEGEVSRWSGVVPLFFTPPGREDAVSSGISNFDIDDEMVYGLRTPQDAKVLATTWTPNRKHLKGTDPQPYVYGVSPMVWSQTKGKGRIVFFVPGKNEATWKHPAIRTMLRRSVAWASQNDKVDEWSEKDDLAALVYPPGGPLAPQKAVDTLQIHPEFKVDLVAAEPLISKPLNIDWDHRGRMWVVESLEYPEGKRGGGPESMHTVWQRDTPLEKPVATDRPGRDRISILEDSDGDGVMDRKQVFAEDLDLATSFCFYKDGVVVAQPPHIYLIRDTNNDGKSDRREILYTGLGTFDTHAVLNNLRWGLDGWIYATHGYSSSNKVTSGDGKKDFGAIGSGVIRFRPDGSAIEMYSAKSGNCWGVDMTSEGEMFFTQPTSGDLVMHVPVSDKLMAAGGMGRDPSWQVMVHLRPVKPLMSWEEIVENQPNDVIGSFTAACGCAVYEGGAWPDQWTRGYFTAEPTVHIIHHEALSVDGPTFSAAKTREEEFSATRDFWSRPIDTRVGPDGQLYVIDFYNQAILHNDPRGPIHLWNHQAARPDRDHFFGRIHRYHHKDSKPLPKADLTNLEGCLAALSHPNREIRFRAQRMIEEGDLKAAATKLAGAKGVTKLHSLWIRAAAGVLSPQEITAALEDPDTAVRVTIGRVIGAYPKLVNADVVATVAKHLPAENDSRVRLQWLAGLPEDAVLSADVLVGLQAKTEDIWTRAAIGRLAKNRPAEVLATALASPAPEKQAPLAALLFDAFGKDGKTLASMLEAIGQSGAKGTAIATASLRSLRNRELPADAKLDEVLAKLAASPTPQIAASALPLAAVRWNEAEAKQKLPPLTDKLLTTAPNDPEVLGPLGTLPAFNERLEKALAAALSSGDAALRGPVLEAVVSNGSADAAALMIEVLPALATTDKARVIEAVLGRPASAILLAQALDKGDITVAVAGTQVLSRLADHADPGVREKSAPMIKRLRGAVEAKDALITRLLPEVSKPGNAEAGKGLYAACAVCHVFHGEGVTIGPVLEGIGVHGVEALLTHIVDPNREVEPSYHVWNISTKDGRTLAGFISRETEGCIFVKNAAGETEVARDQIANRTDTGKSLMPEGFEALGPETLRDLITYLRSGEQRFQTVAFGKAATADGSRGVYMSAETAGDRVGLKRYGMVEERGVPFQLPDPATASGGKNVIVLKGGMEPRSLSQTMPKQVEIPVNLAAGRLHLLGAVAGWGFPVANDQEPLVKIEVRYSDGSTENVVLRNGVEFSDHVARVDVPGSAWTDLTNHGQMRYLWRDLKKPSATIEKLILTSADRGPAPMIAAITLESAGKDGKMAAAPTEGGPVPGSNASLPDKATPGTLRVLLAGGGSSHDFGQWYDREDQAILKEAGGIVSIYTTSPETAAEQLANADVLLFSSNDAGYSKSKAFREAFGAFANRGGGMVLLHPATWYNWVDWAQYNISYVGGGSRAHDPLGEFGLTVLKPDHPVVKGLNRDFKIHDEHYQIVIDPRARVEVLIETSVSGQTGKKHPSVWTVTHPKAKIVCIAPGHDQAAHKHPDFRKLLVNAVKWAGAK
jgi:putative membrane-bound dehydrogenase-like protein